MLKLKLRLSAIAVAVLALAAGASCAQAQTVKGSATLSAAGTSSRVALPSQPSAGKQPNSAILLVPAPASAEEVFYATGDSTVTATTSSAALPAGGICVYISAATTHVAAITATGTTTVRLTQLNACPFFSGPAGAAASP